MKLIFTFLILYSIQVHAMKPGPFEDVHYEDSKTHFRLESVLDKTRGQFSSTGHTTIYDDKKKVIWKNNEFVGRKKIQLSPDGQILALIGNFYFVERIQPYSGEEIVVLYNEKGVLKKITLADLYGDDLDKLVKRLGIPALGGDWISFDDLVKDVRIDWVKKTVAIKFVENKNYSFSF